MVKIIRVRAEYASRHPTFVQINKKLHAEQPIAVHHELCELPDAVGADDPAWFDPLSKNHPFPRPLNLELNQDDLEILYRLSKGMRIDGHPNISELKRKLSKADFRESHQEEIVAFRNLPENKARAVATAKRWKQDNPENTKRHKQDQKEKAYLQRPPVAVDAEGQTYEGNDIKYNDALFPAHHTYLWGSSLDISEFSKVEFLHPKTQVTDWLCNEDKAPLTSVQILNWLLTRPLHYGPNALFVAYAFDYDVTQIPKDLPRKKVWEICRHEKFSVEAARRAGRLLRRQEQVLSAKQASKLEDKASTELPPFDETLSNDQNDETDIDADDIETVEQKPRLAKKNIYAPVFWKDFAIKYLKGKHFYVARLRDPNKPYKELKNGKKKLDVDSRIMIYDVRGFYQTSFTAVAKNLIDQRKVTPDEKEDIAFMEAMKGLRNKTEEWAALPLETIKRYTSIELRFTSRAVAVLRDGFHRVMGIHLKSWSGAGSAAGALIRKMGLKEIHYPNDIKTKDPPRWQVAAHHAYFGGRIEMMKQGYLVKGELHIYDVASAYPSTMVELPSMRDGKWKHEKALSPSKTLAEIRARLDSGNILSMYKVKFAFPTYAKERKSRAEIEYFPFFPLPYRTKRGLILFPSTGYGWYMRDDVLAAVAWLQAFVSGLPKGKLRERMTLEIEEAWIFNPGNAEKPYAFIEPLYEQRRILKEIGDDVGQTAIKLPLNSIYGKTAQAVGKDDKPPPSACPYYAAATTAHCRRKLIEASLLDPSAIVFFATDGIVSERKLEGLPRVKIPGKNRVDLGDWEYAQAESGLFVQAGVYWYGKIIEKDGKRTIKFVSKTRGGDPKKYDKEADVWKWLTDNTLPKWEEPFDHRAQITFPKLEKEYQYYITAGSAVASLQRWKVCGRFSKGAKRTIHVHSPGTKRCWNEDRPWEYTTGKMTNGTIRQADRCSGLIATLPAPNNDRLLSRMRMPDWLDYDEDSVNFFRDQEAIMEGLM